jgi:hypothetical protein
LFGDPILLTAAEPVTDFGRQLREAEWSGLTPPSVRVIPHPLSGRLR